MHSSTAEEKSIGDSGPREFKYRYLPRRKPVDEIFNIEHGNKLTQIISRIDEEDAAGRYEVEIEDNKVPGPDRERAASVDSPPPRKIIAWDDRDPENPYNWSTVRI
jgi:hypothetical protein